MKFGRVSATSYCNYSLLHILLLDVFCSAVWNLVEYKLIFPIAILCDILIIRYDISYVFYEVLLTKLSIVDRAMVNVNIISDCIRYPLI